LSTRNRLITQAIPIPRAAHWTHQCPGEVIQLMTKSITRIAGPMNRGLRPDYGLRMVTT
jgi:hypothetical protein